MHSSLWCRGLVAGPTLLTRVLLSRPLTPALSSVGRGGLLFSRPRTPALSPVGRGGCSFRGPSPQPSPLRGEGVPDNWPVPVITVGRPFGAGRATRGRGRAGGVEDAFPT